jgi:hypothetical protein
MGRVSLGILSKGQEYAFPAAQPQSGNIEVVFVTQPGSNSADTARLEVICDNGAKISRDLTRQNNDVTTIHTTKPIVSIKNIGPSELSVTVITP